jgi:hypothetical protein
MHLISLTLSFHTWPALLMTKTLLRRPLLVVKPAAKAEDYEPSNTSIDIRPTPSHWYVIGIFSRSLKYICSFRISSGQPPSPSPTLCDQNKCPANIIPPCFIPCQVGVAGLGGLGKGYVAVPHVQTRRSYAPTAASC